MAASTSKELEQVIANLVDEDPDGEIVKKAPSRASKREAWETAPFDDAVREQISDMVQDDLGLVDLGTGPRELEPAEVDMLVSEILCIDEISDALKGRRNAIRKMVFGVLDMIEGPDEPGDLASEAHGKRLTRVVRGGKPFVNWSHFEKVVSDEVWEQVTNRVQTTTQVFDGDEVIETSVHEERVPSESKVMSAIDSGLISLDDLKASMDFTKKVPAFNVFAL